jgi:hypothetical protein
MFIPLLIVTFARSVSRVRHPSFLRFHTLPEECCGDARPPCSVGRLPLRLLQNLHERALFYTARCEGD